MAALGFYFKRLEVRGHKNKPPASINFEKGLNVVSGASDTGKSYLLQCLDFLTGAGTPPEPIEEAKGYGSLWLEIQTWDKKSYTIMRSLQGGDAELYESLLHDIGDIDPNILKAKKRTKKCPSISDFLLGLCGLPDVELIAKKSDNTKWNLKFRAVAHLCLIDEVRIFTKDSPVHGSGIITSKTMEESFFRYLITGTDDSSVVTAPTEDRKDASVSVRIEVIEGLVKSTNAEISALTDSPDEIEEQLGKITESLEESTRAISIDREKLRENQKKRNQYWEDIQSTQGRIEVLDRLTDRFELLDQYYESDLRRLKAMSEAGNYLSQLPELDCPLCGTEEPWNNETDLTALQVACSSEVRRTQFLQDDLTDTNSDIRDEINRLTSDLQETGEEHSRVTQIIEQQLHPSADVLNTELNELIEKQRQLERAAALLGQRDRLQLELDNLSLDAVDTENEILSNLDSATTTSDTTEFCKEVRKLLKDWKFPGAGPVTFSEKKQDIVINGKDRSSHGKGIRALSYAAFTIGLLRYCQKHKRPCPGFVVLDSPLVAYREPDSQSLVEEAGVADNFYESLTKLKTKQQIIIFENRDPQDELEDANLIHFSGDIDEKGRYGFFPV